MAFVVTRERWPILRAALGHLVLLICVSAGLAGGCGRVDTRSSPPPTEPAAAAASVPAAAASGVDQESGGAPGGVVPGDDPVQRLVDELGPTLRQRLSDALYAFEASPSVELDRCRPILGPASARVRITVFTDVGCGRCATLHGALDYVRSRAPAAAFCVELRHYPIDGTCNPHLERRGEQTVRCTAARVMICAEEHPRAFELAGVLYGGGLMMSRERALEIGAAFIGWDELTACLHDPELERRLEADTDLGQRLGIASLPRVLLNGRRASDFAPFLYLMVLTGGSTSHPALSVLPPPAVD